MEVTKELVDALIEVRLSTNARDRLSQENWNTIVDVCTNFQMEQLFWETPWPWIYTLETHSEWGCWECEMDGIKYTILEKTVLYKHYFQVYNSHYDSDDELDDEVSSFNEAVRVCKEYHRKIRG